jgi:hypothetical protein
MIAILWGCAIFFIAVASTYFLIFVYALTVGAMKTKSSYGEPKYNPDDYWDGEPMAYAEMPNGEVRLDSWR